MKARLILLFLLLGSGLALTACDRKEEPAKPKQVTPQELREQAGKLLELGRDFLNQQKEKYLKDLDSQLQELQKRIAAVREELSKAAPELQAKLEDTLKQLQQQEEKVRQRLEETKTATGQAWEELRQRLEQEQPPAAPEKPRQSI